MRMVINNGLSKFPMGQVLFTSRISDYVFVGTLNPVPYIERHMSGDWGDMDAHDKRQNDNALAHGGRIFSAYETPIGKIWIITEAHRKTTTILLPEEY